MPHLGELAAAASEASGEPITFDWHGQRLRCRVELPALALMELAAVGEEIKGTPAESDLMVVGGAFFRFLEALIEPSDWTAFRRLSTLHGDGPDQLLPVVTKLAEAIAGRPTRQPSVSPAGRPATPDGSTGHSPSERAFPFAM